MSDENVWLKGLQLLMQLQPCIILNEPWLTSEFGETWMIMQALVPGSCQMHPDMAIFSTQELHKLEVLQLEIAHSGWGSRREERSSHAEQSLLLARLSY